MCSKSIVFDPQDVKLPMIKIAYKNCDEITIWPGDIKRSESNVLSVVCSQYAEMLPKNIIAPYTFRNEKREFLFNFHYAQVGDYINQLCQLRRASNLHAIEQNDMVYTIYAIFLSKKKNYYLTQIELYTCIDCSFCLFTAQKSEIQSTLAR